MLIFSKFKMALNTICGIEKMNMIRNGQVVGVAMGDIVGWADFVNEIFGVAACAVTLDGFLCLRTFFVTAPDKLHAISRDCQAHGPGPATLHPITSQAGQVHMENMVLKVEVSSINIQR